MGDDNERTTKKPGDTITLEWHRRIGQDPRLTKDNRNVGRTLIDWANRDGTSIRPGRKLLAERVGLSGPRHVTTHLHALMRAGYLYRVFEGNATNGKADEFRLVFPEWGFGSGTSNDQLAEKHHEKWAEYFDPRDAGVPTPRDTSDPTPRDTSDPTPRDTSVLPPTQSPTQKTNSDLASLGRPFCSKRSDIHDDMTDDEWEETWDWVEREVERRVGAQRDGADPQAYAVIYERIQRGESNPAGVAAAVANQFPTPRRRLRAG